MHIECMRCGARRKFSDIVAFRVMPCRGADRGKKARYVRKSKDDPLGEETPEQRRQLRKQRQMQRQRERRAKEREKKNLPPARPYCRRGQRKDASGEEQQPGSKKDSKDRKRAG